MDDKRVPDLPQDSGQVESGFDVDETIDKVGCNVGTFDPFDPARRARLETELEFLRNYIFRGLNDLKPDYDSPLIAHFRAADFLRVIARCKRLGIPIHGVEIFGPQGQLRAVEIAEENSGDWCVLLVQRYQHRVNLSFCASYTVPNHVLNMSPESLEFLAQV